MDFDTMRVNCIEIHQQTYELFCVTDHIGETLNIKVKSADELKTHPETKTWDGMGRYAKEMYDNEELWKLLPTELRITLPFNSSRIHWIKEKARESFLNCYHQLGGKHLFEK